MHRLTRLMSGVILAVFPTLGLTFIAPSAIAQPGDNDCALHAVGYAAGLTPEQVADRTHVMMGPAHDENAITGMLTRLNIGNGTHPHFPSRQAAYNYINSRNARYILAYTPQDGHMGHVINARSYNQALTFLDCQQGNNNQPPDNCREYIVWFVRLGD